MKPASPRTIYLLWRSSLAVKQVVDHCGKSAGVTLAQYVLLSLLQSREGLSSAEVARRLGVAPQTTNEAVTALTRAGYVAKEPMANSRKTLRLVLTPAGADYLAQAEEIINAAEAYLFAGLSDQELADLRRAAKSIVDRAKRLSEDDA